MKTQMSAHRNFTTTLPDALLQELDCAAKELRVQKNDILIDAFVAWNKRRKQALLAESYRRVNKKDTEDLVRLADEGLLAWEKTIPA